MKIVQRFAIGFLVAAVTSTTLAHAQKYIVLHAFTGPDGREPFAGVIRDSAGNLYGTTGLGGTSSGAGVVFKLDPAGNETVLYSFTGAADGSAPFASLIGDSAGNFYGTTYRGGTSGAGVVFKLDPAGKESVLHSFTGGMDGGFPYAGLIRDSAGNLYGTTTVGGTTSGVCGASVPAGCGVVFKLDPTGTYTVLHSFTGPDGNFPWAGLIRDSVGNLYGVTSGGGTGYGVVFKLDPTGTYTVLHSFKGPDGSAPRACLIRDSAGNLYGTTYNGGASNAGVVFKLDPAGRESVLYSFTGGTDGEFPYTAGLIRDAAGNLYGTTALGGTSAAGVVFILDPTGKETVLYSFKGGADGGGSFAGLIQDSAGNIYGTNASGGTSNDGGVFELIPGVVSKLPEVSGQKNRKK